MDFKYVIVISIALLLLGAVLWYMFGLLIPLEIIIVVIALIFPYLYWHKFINKFRESSTSAQEQTLPKWDEREPEAWTGRLGRVFGIPLAIAISKLPYKVTPNMISVVSLIPAIFAGYFFFVNQLVFGAILFWVSYCLDCADGSLARLTNQETPFGRKLDFYIDIIGNVFMYFGLWYSQFYLVGSWLWGGAIIFAHYCITVFGYMFVTNRAYKTVFPGVSSYYGTGAEGFFTFLILPAFNVVFIGLPILVGLQFVNYLILYLKQNEKPNIAFNVRKTLKKN